MVGAGEVDTTPVSGCACFLAFAAFVGAGARGLVTTGVVRLLGKGAVGTTTASGCTCFVALL